MVVDYGQVVPEGRLPVFSTKTAECAQQLIVLACGTNQAGEYIARELVLDQTLDNLEAFSTRLDEAHDHLIAVGSCRCG